MQFCHTFTPSPLHSHFQFMPPLHPPVPPYHVTPTPKGSGVRTIDTYERWLFCSSSILPPLLLRLPFSPTVSRRLTGSLSLSPPPSHQGDMCSLEAMQATWVEPSRAGFWVAETNDTKALVGCIGIRPTVRSVTTVAAALVLVAAPQASVRQVALQHDHLNSPRCTHAGRRDCWRHRKIHRSAFAPGNWSGFCATRLSRWVC